VALGLTAFVLVIAIRRGLHFHTQTGWLLPLDFLLQGWPLIAVNALFYAYLCWLGFWFIRGTAGAERFFMMGWFAKILLSPLETLRPEWAAAINHLGTLGLAVALLAALWILLQKLGADRRPDSRSTT